MPDKWYSLFAVAFLVFVLFHVVAGGGRIGYDAARNEKIISEVAFSGTFTYFDVPFIVSPPLYFIIHSVPVALLGTGQEVFRATEAALYFLGALLVFFILRELGLPKKIGLLFFLLVLADSQMFSIQTIDFWGAILLFSGLVFLFYARLFKNPTALNVLGFGASVGLSMLVKSSFIFLILPLALVYVIFHLPKREGRKIGLLFASLVIGILIYSPWMYYLTSNGFPLITNPEAQGKLPWDPDFKGFTYQEIYWGAWTGYWPLLYPFSVIMGLYLLAATFRSVKFEGTVSLAGKIKYFYYKHGEQGAIFLSLLLVILTLPFFNRLLVGIPVGEQFLSIGLAFYLLLSLVLVKAKEKRVQYLIAAVLVVNALWGFAVIRPVLATQEHQFACPLYTEFFTTMGPGQALLLDEKISRVAYPAHNALYRGFFEWFSYQENYDAARIITLNADYIVLTQSNRTPSYLQTTFFEKGRQDNCKDLRGRPPYQTVVYRVADRDGFSRAAGLGEKAQLKIMSGELPIQAAVRVRREGFDLEYKSKRDGSLTVYVPSLGSYSLDIIRPGFKPVQLTLEVPGSGERLIHLERDSPFVTHTTANRY